MMFSKITNIDNTEQLVKTNMKFLIDMSGDIYSFSLKSPPTASEI